MRKERESDIVQAVDKVFLRRTNKTLCRGLRDRVFAVIPAATGRGTYLTRDSTNTSECVYDGGYIIVPLQSLMGSVRGNTIALSL